MNEFESKILRIGKPTGSRVFYCAKGYSDYDYFVSEKQFQKLKNLVNWEDCEAVKYNKRDCKDSFSFESIKIGADFPDKINIDDFPDKINIIVVKSEWYSAWKFATEQMKLMVYASGYFRWMIEEKDKRVEVFEDLKKYYYENKESL